MFHSTLGYLPSLAVAMGVNLALGVYLNIGVKKLDFCWKKFWDGILKTVILAVAFLGLAYCFDATNLKSLGISPDTIMTAAIALYVTKDCVKLANLLGVQTGTNTQDTSNSGSGALGTTAEQTAPPTPTQQDPPSTV